MVVPKMETKYPEIIELAKQRNVLGEQDKILQYISSHFISISESDNKSYRAHLIYVVTMIGETMKMEPSFAAFYEKQCVSGSFWDGLKVGKPDEFDINVILRLPFEFKVLPAEYRSHVNIRVVDGEIERLKKNHLKWKQYSKIEKWVDEEGFLKPDEIRSYMESVISKALRKFDKHANGYCSFKKDNTTYTIKLEKNGPALTLKVSISPEEKQFSIDLVPAFEFSCPLPWSPSKTRRCPQQDKPWYVVPKPLKLEDGTWVWQKSPWRLSFHNHESELIRDTHHLKPVLKFLKKLRDKHQLHGLASYYIKTVFLWEVERNTPDFWSKQLSYVFLYMLAKLIDVAEKRIPSYWDKKANLLHHMEEGHFNNLIGKLKNLHKQMMNGLIKNDRYAIASLLLSNEEFKKFESSYQ